MIELFALAKGVMGFLGGTTFRMVWGEISSMLTARQEHKHELERMRLQGDLDAAAHERNLAAQRLQADLGIKVIQVQSEADLGKLEAEAFKAGVEGLSKLSGFNLIDAWKSAIQPALATMMMVMLAMHYHSKGWVLDDKGWELAGAILGLFVADRLLFRRGK